MSDEAEVETYTWKDVPGWTESFADFYKQIAAGAVDGDRFVEVGTHVGKSAILMASCLRDAGKKVSFDAIDSYSSPHFDGSPKMWKHYVKLCGVEGFVNLRVVDMVEGAAAYPDGSLAFVFLDADHSKDGTVAAIRAYLPKVRPGGILAGDDYDIFQFPHVVEAVQQELAGRVEFQGRTFICRVPA